jgi:hypothetical protein
MTTIAPILLAVVEVAREDRVLCMAPGCNHSVFRRIHVVFEDGRITVVGSECFKKFFTTLSASAPRPKYGSSGGRLLTADERQLLIENRELLIQQFEEEYQTELKRLAEAEAVRQAARERAAEAEAMRRAALERAAEAVMPRRVTLPPPPVGTPSRHFQSRNRPVNRQSLLEPAEPRTPEYLAAEVQAKKNIRDKYGVDPEHAGSRGLVLYEIEELLKSKSS